MQPYHVSLVSGYLSFEHDRYGMPYAVNITDESCDGILSAIAETVIGMAMRGYPLTVGCDIILRRGQYGPVSFPETRWAFNADTLKGKGMQRI